MRKAGVRDYACPCCGGELVGVPEADLGLGGDEGISADEFRDEPLAAREWESVTEAELESDLDSDGDGEESEASSDGAGGLEFDGRGATAMKAIREFGWDGRAETMPSEWKGRGYFVIATYGEVRRGARRRVVMDGCIVTCFGRAGKTSFRSGKDALSPMLFEDVEAARRALRDAWDWTIGRWADTRIASRDLIERKFWYSDEFVKAAEVIPVEAYRPVRRMDVLAELAEEALAEMGDAERERDLRRREESSRLAAERARLRSRGVATARETERWLLQDWETGKFVRVEGGTATLVDRDDCTFFERLADANGVAIGIERLFWRTEFARWRLHVVPLCGTV